MQRILAFAAGVFGTSIAFAATPASAIEHSTAPQGQRLPFSDAVRVGNVLYLSGQIGIGPDGKLPEGIEAQTRQSLKSVGEILKRRGLDYRNIFHCTAMLADMKLWPAFNKTYLEFFPEPPLPTRSAFGVNGIALGALIEIECQAYVGKKK